MSKLWNSLLNFGSNPASIQTKPARLDPADRHKFSVGPAIVPDDHAPENLSSTTVSVPIPSKKKAPMQLASREALVAKDKSNAIVIKELMAMVEAREIIIAKLKLEIADSNTRSPADHEPKLCPEIREPVANIDAKADDHTATHSKCEDHEPNMKSEDGLANLVEMQQNLIAALQTEMGDMTKIMSEKDKTIMELKSDIDDSSRHREGQLEQLLWLDSMVNEKDAKIYDRELALYAMGVTMSDQATTINTLQAKLDLQNNLPKVQYWRSANQEQDKKFRALYSHCRSLANERDKLQDHISALSICEAKTKELSDQQQQLTKSLLALVVKEKKTKFINGSHSLDYSVTEPIPAVREEIANSKSRIRREDITRLANLVDTLAHKYSPDINRYSQSNPTDDNEQVCVTNPENLPLAVPKEMYAIWLHSHEEDLTEEEELQYNGYLARGLRPPPIYSPNLPKPYVNWMRFNPNMRRNLPLPMMCPKLGCSQDPNFYNLTVPTTNQTPYTRHYTDHPPTPVFEKGEPFGSEYGFMTEMGVMPVPSTPVHGFVFYGGSWVIASGYYGG